MNTCTGIPTSRARTVTPTGIAPPIHIRMTATPEDVAPFSFRLVQDGRVLISWRGRLVTTLAGAAADRLRERRAGANEANVQLLLAKATGNFKRGNERRAS